MPRPLPSRRRPSSWGSGWRSAPRWSGLPTDRLVDGGIELPDVSRRSVRIFGAAVPLPDFDDAEDLVHRLVRASVVVRDPMVRGVLRGRPPDATARTVRRHFLAATGLAPGMVRQIERAREAAMLVRNGASIADLAHDLGYYDPPHLARSLRRFIGCTATELRTEATDGGYATFGEEHNSSLHIARFAAISARDLAAEIVWIAASAQRSFCEM